MILKYHNERHSYGPDKLIYGHFWPLSSKCDLDLGDIDVILLRGTPSNDDEQMCHIILKSHKEGHSYGPNKHLTFELKVWPWLGDIDLILSRDTPSNDGEQMYQMILKSNDKWHCYGLDKLLVKTHLVTQWPSFWPGMTHIQTWPIQLDTTSDQVWWRMDEI